MKSQGLGATAIAKALGIGRASIYVPVSLRLNGSIFGNDQ
jgi:hypothetical protein